MHIQWYNALRGMGIRFAEEDKELRRRGIPIDGYELLWHVGNWICERHVETGNTRLYCRGELRRSRYDIATGRMRRRSHEHLMGLT